MKALVLKELREILWLGVLGLLVFTSLLGSEYLTYREAMAAMIRGEGEPRHLLQPLLGNAWEYTGFFCAIFAAVLGGLQMFNERLRNVWAFLFHRPMTPSAIFLAKIVAGLGLYLVATGLPLVVFVAWAAQPGNVAAPFDWQMVLPPVAFCFGGAPYYFAGVLSGARRARWYGSRTLGLGSALVVSLGMIGSTSLWRVATFLLVGTVALGVAAWACFCNSGYDQRQHPAGKPALAISLAFGWIVMLFICAAIVADVVERLRPSPLWTYHAVLRNGSIWSVTQGEKTRARVSDLQGNPVRHPGTGESITLNDVQAERAEQVSMGTALSEAPLTHRALFRKWGQYGYWGSSSGTLWYFIRQERRLAGYDAVSRRFIGTIGPEGFATNLNGSGAEFTFLTARTLGTATTLVSADPAKRTANPVFATSTNDPITHVGDVVVSGQRWIGTLVLTRKALHLVTPEGKTTWAVDFPVRYPDAGDLKVHILEPPGSFVVWNDPPFPKSKDLTAWPPSQVTWVKDGKITATAAVPIYWRPQGWPGVQEHLTGAVAPPFLVAMLPSAFGFDFSPEWRRVLLLSGFAALVCAPIAWIIARRRNVSASGCLAWSVGVFVLGLPGLLALLSIEDTPPRETPRQPMPEIEIFEPATVSR